MKEKIKFILKTILYALMSVQIVLGLIWMAANITTIPSFGDTTEYISLSFSLKPDEYRTILYPLLLKVAIWVGAHINVPYQILVYIGQAGLSLICIYYTCSNVFKWSGIIEGRIKTAFYSLFVFSIPTINFLNFTILTDSLALSFLLIVIVQIVKVWKNEKVGKWDVALLVISFLLEAMIRADRIYTCSIFLVIYSIIQVIKKADVKRFVLVFISIAAVIILAIGINKVTQTKGLYNRVETNLSFILLDRVVWPNMVEDYEDFDEGIKNTISLEEAKQFDKHNNNVMYYIAPLVEERVGKERASQMYMDMAKVVMSNHPGKVIGDTLKCFLGFEFPHTNAYLSYHGITKTNNNWNLRCWSGVTPKLSDAYYHYYVFFTGIVMFALAIIVAVYQLLIRHNVSLKKYIRCLLPLFGICTLICIWFAVGDGAPPNDRYVTICHVAWALYIYGTFELILSSNTIANIGESNEG